MNNNMGRNRGILSVTSDAKALIAKIDKIIEKIDVNGLRIKVDKIRPLPEDICIKAVSYTHLTLPTTTYL